MKISEILRAGKVNIEKFGWCQGDELAIHGPDSGPCCAATALTRVPITWAWDGKFPGNEAINLLKQAAGVSTAISIATWNDAPERTLAEVLAAYDKAIVAAEAQELT